MDELTGIVARAGFLPHGYCFQWSPGLLWTMVSADLAIALAYFSIPLVIASYARKRPQVNLGSLATLFVIFIAACGVTHLLDVWTIWRPDYELQTAGKVFTAVASVLTAIVAWRLMPMALALPSVEEMRVANAALREEVDRRHSAEDNLLETEQTLAATLAAIDAGFITTDAEGRVTRINAVAEAITGWPAAEALGVSVWQVFDRLDRPAEMLARNPVDVVAEHRRDGVMRMTVVCIARGGVHTPVDLQADLTHHRDGRVRGMSLVFRDIGRLTQAEAEVRRLAAVVESSADAIVVKTLDGRITNWNAAAERMFGYAADEVVGRPVQLLIPPEREAEEMRVLASLAQGQQVPPFRTVHIAKDGRRIEISAQVSPLRDAAGRIIGGVKSARDLTHQRQIEAALRHSEARLRFALESAAIGDWEMELESGQIHPSRRFDQCLGGGEATGAWNRERMLAAVHGDDRAMVQAGLDGLHEDQPPWHAEFRVLWADGSAHWLRLDARVTRDDAGAPRLVGIVADVTAMRTAEQARQQSIWLAAENRRVQESSRLKSLFLANMSHELRTPLNAVIGFADLLNMSPQPLDTPRHREWLQHISSSGRHLLAMINDVLDLSKIEAGRMDFHAEPLDPRAVVDDVIATVAVLAEQAGLSLQAHVDADLDDLVLDAARLKQVLLNYLSNAIKFTPRGGHVELRMVGEGPRQWRLEVQDDGIGIAPERQGQLFVEFQQLDDGLTKHHQGTGLGLALTRRLVEAQGGRVGVYSRAGQGSRFYAVLPRQPEPADGDVRREVHQQLVALRDHPLRDGVARELALAGVAADTAATAADVLRLARTRRYTELALDLALPDSPGLSMLAALRGGGGPSMHAAVKALALTPASGAGVAFPVSDVLAKPLRRAALARALVPLRERFAPDRPVLVVDDEAGARELMCAALAANGIAAVALPGGAEALQALPRLQPAALVLDLMMPGLDGFQVLHELRSDPRWAELPVIVWTALTLSAEDIETLARTASAIASAGEDRPLRQVRDALLGAARQGRRGRRPPGS
ncbi:PAS domain S-box protein [Roseateles asaccharophilus]|uniref:histidine kinase n=1 Tax=Roseateles asaccharophilus TaxID=582607 RepID=A0ABU2AE37_9BURK|nr:PAS domain S-box protein [Roseateles asaccharophilus]MDR7335464.1 PAS domain S-box-containing protein [Roseateles asaccharophilus]